VVVVVQNQDQLGYQRFQLVVAQTSCRLHARAKFGCMAVAVLDVVGFQVVAASVVALLVSAVVVQK